MNNAQNIPVVDLAEFLSDDKEAKKAFADKLGEAFETIGFVAVKNHLVDNTASRRLYHLSRLLFSMPAEEKQKYEIEGLAGQRGYTSFGKEHAKGRSEGDLKEFWHIGQEVEDGDPVGEQYPENIVPTQLTDFHEAGMIVYRMLENTGTQLLRAIALHLNLPENYFDRYVHNGNSILRPIHYGPITTAPNDAVRAAEHEDINLITLLIGASAEGLEIQSKQGEWIPVTALPDQLVVNVGDMLQRLTNNKLRSSTHRVVNPSESQWSTSRYSIPFFMHPRPDMPLNCLESCIDAGHPKAYEDITAGEYLMERLHEIGLAKK